MNYQIQITERAKSDLTAAADYIEYALRSPDAANRLLDKAGTEMESLSRFPYRNQLVADPALAAWGLRFLTVDNYLLFYIISEKTAAVFVVRFLYAKRNWISVLKNEEDN